MTPKPGNLSLKELDQMSRERKRRTKRHLAERKHQEKKARSRGLALDRHLSEWD